MNLVLVSCLLLLATLCAAQNRPNPRPVTYREDDASINTHFQRFKLRHGKKYRNSAHEAYKKTVFKSKVQEINRHNRLFQQGRRKYTMDINFFTDLEEHEFKNHFGHIRKRSKRSAPFPISLVQNTTLLPYFDWRVLNKVSPVKNQGGCGTCWVFTGVAALESQYAIKFNTSVPDLSEQNIVDCYDKWGPNSAGTCSPGGDPIWVWDYSNSQNGLYYESDYPYTGRYSGQCANKTTYNPTPSSGTAQIISTVNIPGDETLMAQTISSLGPIAISLYACPSFMSYSGGIFDDPTCNKPINHGVVFVGYGTFNGSDYFILRNSWGQSWGQNGYMFIARNKNTCGLTFQPMIPQISDTITRNVCMMPNVNISCGTGSSIRIQSANYGRTDSTVCYPMFNDALYTNCTSDQTLTIGNLCNGSSSCTLSANAHLYSPDPCPKVFSKYLTVTYQCVIS